MSACAYGPRCAGWDRAAQAAGLAYGGPLCADCELDAAREVAGLGRDHDDLGALIARRDVACDVRVTTSGEPAVPLDLAVDALMRDIAWSLALWEDPVREAAGLTPAPTYPCRPAWTVGRALRVLTPRVSLLAALPAMWCYADGVDQACVERSGFDGLCALRRLHSRAFTVLGLSSPLVRLPGACPRCGTEALTRESAAEAVNRIHARVLCAHCGMKIEADAYADYVEMRLDAATRTGDIPAPRVQISAQRAP